MFTYTKRLYYFFSFLFLSSLFSHNINAQSVSLYTPITKVTVPPGQEINYNIDVINNSNSIKTSNIKILGLPKDWSYQLKSGNWNVEQISTLPKKKERLTLKLNVPLKVDKGLYKFRVIAEGYSSLPLTVSVSKQGVYQAEFTSKQPNIEGASNTSFTYNATLRNSTAIEQVYALKATLPSAGWQATFKANGKQVSSVSVKANQTQSITIEIKPSKYIKAGSYKIPVSARAGNIFTQLELETVIIGTYDVALNTPTNLLSAKAVAGDSKKIKLLVTNTGSATLNDIKLKARTPSKWTVDFDPKEVDQIEAGKSKEIEATINVNDDALSGDYEINFDVKSSETSTQQKFRITVHTSILSGWLGILIILIAFGGVYYLIKKYGRR